MQMGTCLLRMPSLQCAVACRGTVVGMIRFRNPLEAPWRWTTFHTPNDVGRGATIVSTLNLRTVKRRLPRRYAAFSPRMPTPPYMNDASPHDGRVTRRPCSAGHHATRMGSQR
jgi:hypothetical protein